MFAQMYPAHAYIAIASGRCPQKIRCFAVVLLCCLQSQLSTPGERVGYVLPVHNPPAVDDTGGRARSRQACVAFRAYIDNLIVFFQSLNQGGAADAFPASMGLAVIAARRAEQASAYQDGGAGSQGSGHWDLWV